MDNEKIEELKKLIVFEVLIIERIKNDCSFNLLMDILPDDKIIELFINNVCAFDLGYTTQNIKGNFAEPSTTNLIEKVYKECLKHVNKDTGTEIRMNGN